MTKTDIMDADAPELTIIVVSYNTCELTLKALETLYANTYKTRFHTVVLDNASEDGSADAIAKAFPQVELIRSAENLGFARANNEVAAQAETEWLLLLNPDTETYDSAIDNLLDFGKANPEAGIYGGRTVYPDGSLNPSSCWNKITLRSTVFRALGLTTMFRKSSFFNPEEMGDWQRDTVRHVDIVVGCFLLIRRDLWNELGGFNLKYFMYGEEADLCHRAQNLGYSPMITPDAEIMHLVGASTTVVSRKIVSVFRARVTLIRDHWPAFLAPVGVFLMWLGVALRVLGGAVLSRILGKTERARASTWTEVWQHRATWMAGY